MLMQKRRNVGKALDLLRRLLIDQRVSPVVILTRGLRSNIAALRELGLRDRRKPWRLQGINQAETSHRPIQHRP